jgi:hypothetical protein
MDIQRRGTEGKRLSCAFHCELTGHWAVMSPGLDQSLPERSGLCVETMHARAPLVPDWLPQFTGSTDSTAAAHRFPLWTEANHDIYSLLRQIPIMIIAPCHLDTRNELPPRLQLPAEAPTRSSVLT